MDKNSLSNYGWIIICLIVLGMMIALANPLGTYAQRSIKNSVTNFGGKAADSINQTVNLSATAEPAGATFSDRGFVPWETLVSEGYCSDTEIYYNETSYDYAFFGQTKLLSIVIPDSVTDISHLAFAYCRSLEKVIFGNNVVSIGSEAFYNCYSLKNITIPKSIRSIGFDTFKHCRSLSAIVVDENNTVYDSRNNCNAIIESNNNVLLVGCNNTSIPDSVTKIEDYAFQGRVSIEEITIPNSVTGIGNYAFEGCSSLKNIVLPNSIADIAYCSFKDCISLTSITIPNSVTNITYSAFANCTSLTNVYYKGTQEQWNNISNGGNNSALTKATIHYNS